MVANDILIFTLWWIPVAVAFVVCIVAVGLLQNILVVARNIDANVHTIWTVGKQIANNTVELWLLGKTVGLVKDIRVAAPQINDVAQRIANHASQCHHCPACVSPGGYAAFAGSRGATATLERPATATGPGAGGPAESGPTSPRWARGTEQGAGESEVEKTGEVSPPWAWRSGQPAEPGTGGGEEKK
jgi:hypothetical protein